MNRRKRAFLRQMTTLATERYGIGGLAKAHHTPKPISLPKLTCLEDTEDENDVGDCAGDATDGGGRGD